MAEGKELRDPDGRGCVTLVSQIMGLETSEKIETLVRMLKARALMSKHCLKHSSERISYVGFIFLKHLILYAVL